MVGNLSIYLSIYLCLYNFEGADETFYFLAVIFILDMLVRMEKVTMFYTFTLSILVVMISI